MRKTKFLFFFLAIAGLTGFKFMTKGPDIKANDEPPFVAVGYFYCHDVAEYNQSITKNRDTIINDIKKYTNIQPVIMISEIKQVR
jgi:hypothetical protein